MNDVDPADRNVAIVFQNYALYPHMSVAGNLAFGLQLRHVPKAEIERRIAGISAMLGIRELLDRKPAHLSGGQRQRVALGRALVREPKAFLLDEPLSNLDAKLRLEMRSEIRRIHNSLGATTIYVTHDQEEALSLADRIVVMAAGSVRQVGTPAELYGRPDSLDVADFMGFRNQLAGIVTGIGGDSATVRIGDAELTGARRAAFVVGQPAVVAIRTEDLAATDDATGISATVVTSEFRGHSFTCYGTTADGVDVFFRAARRLAMGENVRLTAPADRALVFTDGAP
jgi:putative spermidine/putrescine transport system ATP-binding protein